jgi:hypothetical protein
MEAGAAGIYLGGDSADAQTEEWWRPYDGSPRPGRIQEDCKGGLSPKTGKAKETLLEREILLLLV